MSIKQSLLVPSSSPNLLSVSTELPILVISYKWNHTVCDLPCPAPFAQRHILEANPHCGISTSSFAWMKIVPCLDAVLCFSIYLLNIWVCLFPFWLLRIMLLWTFVYKSLFK